MLKRDKKAKNLNRARGGDIVIPILGATGTGKSTFINIASGQTLLEVGHNLTTCTKKPFPVVIDPFPRFPDLKGHRLILVDTPGLDNGSKTDEQVLNGIVKFLENSYKNMIICGIIYLYDTSNDRLSSAERMTMERIDRLCKDAALDKIVFATNHCGKLTPEDDERRTNELESTIWKGLIKNGAVVRHFQGTTTSAWQIIDVFLQLAAISSNRVPERFTSPVTSLPHSQTDIDPFQALSNRVGSTNDAVLDDGKKTDIIIPVLGPTGAGKSTFINFALGKDVLEVGHDLISCTAQLHPVVVDPIPGFPSLKGYRLILVDTPGFDDTLVDDVKILADIATWLANSYRKEMVIVGVIYLHDISLKRFTGTARRNLDLFYRIIGKAALRKVILGTTNWGLIPQEADKRHEEEMRDLHWKTLIDQGAAVSRFRGNSASAWDIISVFLEHVDTYKYKLIPLQIQKELVDEGKAIQDTKAGKFYHKMTQKMRSITQMGCFVQ